MPSSSKTTAKEEFEKNLPAVEKLNKELAPYLDGQPYNEGRLISEVEIYVKQHVASGFEVGRRLIVLKAQTEHGRFQELVEGRLQLGLRRARELMSFARICIEMSAVAKGMIDFDKLKSMDSTKVRLLGQVIPEYADELSESGTIKGRTLDEWDTKSRKDLRAELEKRDKELKAEKDKRETLRNKLEATEEQLAAITSHKPDAVAEAITRAIAGLRNVLTDFMFNCECAPAFELPDATRQALVAFQHELRSFHTTIDDTIEERFPEIAALEDAAMPEPAPIRDIPGAAPVRSILKKPAPYKTNGKKGH